MGKMGRYLTFGAIWPPLPLLRPLLSLLLLLLLVESGETLRCLLCNDPCIVPGTNFASDFTCESNFCVKATYNITGKPFISRYCPEKKYHGKPGCTGIKNLVEMCLCNDRKNCNGSEKQSHLSPVLEAALPMISLALVAVMLSGRI